MRVDRQLTILWIDDDRLLLGVCAPALERQGYRVLTATDGSTGIEVARNELPDLILLDVVMPTMYGIDVCQQIREEPCLKDIPVILLTALEDRGIETMGQKAGATMTMRKPFGPEHVFGMIQKVLALRGPEGV